jgi:hypothetical protein
MKYLIFYASLLITSQAHAWVINANFENGSIGNKASGGDGFSNAFTNTKYTNKVVHSGNQAAVTSIKKGETGFGKWGGSFKFPSSLRQGDEFWFRAWIYYPNGFDFSNTGVGVKTLRVNTSKSGGGNEGYFDMLTRGSSGVTVNIEQTRNEFTNNNPQWKGIGPPITTGVWHAFEYYAKLSSSSGKGVFRAWVDGKLILDDTSSNLISSSSEATFAYLWSYFNGGSGKDQEAYVDDVIITNETPSAVDSQGNRFIGTGNAKFTAAPKPPTLN